MTTVSMIGDSQAQGLEGMGGFASVLAAKGLTPLRWWHRAGASTARLIDDLPELFTGPTPDLVIVAAGGNDTPGSGSSWGRMLDALARRGVQRVVWIGPPAGVGVIDAERLAISRAQAAFFATKPNVTWIDGRVTAAGLPRRDEVHLTAEGYREWARRLADVVVGGRGIAAVGLAIFALWGAWKLAERWAR